MKPCPNCNQPVAEGVHLCPNCGADTRVLWEERVGQELEPMNAVYFGTRRRNDKLRMLAGFLTSLMLSSVLPIFFLGSILSALLYYTVREKDRYFGRGVGWGIFAGFCGALTVCSLLFRSMRF